MKNKKIFLFICFIICILFAISSVHAGIFEFVEDTGDTDDAPNQDIYEDDANPKHDEKYEVKKFKIESLDSLSVLDDLIELQDEIDDSESEDFETVYWLTDLMDYVFFEETNGGYLIVNESEADKIPSSDKYSSCTIECKVVDTHFSDWGDYYLVKDVKVLKKVKEEKESTESSSNYYHVDNAQKSDDNTYYSYYSDSSSSSSSESSYDAGTSDSYVGNSNSGKFHASGCRDINKMNEANKVYFSSRDEAVSNGYVPCGHCHP